MSKFKPIVLRQANGYDTEVASNEAMIPADMQGESLTIQSQTEDSDINVIMKRFGITGKLPDNPRVPTYGDFSNVQDFRSALDAVRSAQDAFMEFPSSVRDRFQNDPQLMLEFVGDDKNYDEAVKLGLMKSGARAPVPSGTPQAQPAATQAPGSPAPGAPGST